MKKASKKTVGKIVKAIREGRVVIGNKAVTEKKTPHIEVYKYKAGKREDGSVYPAAQGFIVSWSEPTYGFGELTFDVVDGQLEIHSEGMGDGFILAQFAKLVQHSKIS